MSAVKACPRGLLLASIVTLAVARPQPVEPNTSSAGNISQTPSSPVTSSPVTSVGLTALSSGTHLTSGASFSSLTITNTTSLTTPTPTSAPVTVPAPEAPQDTPEDDSSNDQPAAQPEAPAEPPAAPPVSNPAPVDSSKKPPPPPGYWDVPIPGVPDYPEDEIPNVILKSHCHFPVYLREVVSDTDINVVHPYGTNVEDTVLPPGQIWTSNFYWPNAGVSIKLAKEPWTPSKQPLITQIEYTWEPENDQLYYDLSDIDCYDINYAGERGRDCPFFDNGIVLRSEKDCSILKCPPEDIQCEDVYIHPNDDWETRGCDGKRVNLYADLCPGNVPNFFQNVDAEDPRATHKMNSDLMKGTFDTKRSANVA